MQSSGQCSRGGNVSPSAKLCWTIPVMRLDPSGWKTWKAPPRSQKVKGRDLETDPLPTWDCKLRVELSEKALYGGCKRQH